MVESPPTRIARIPTVRRRARFRRRNRRGRPRVEYELTPLGATLIDPIHPLTEWAQANGEAVLEAFDTETGSPQERCATPSVFAPGA
jgi:hypothetical protein